MFTRQPFTFLMFSYLIFHFFIELQLRALIFTFPVESDEPELQGKVTGLPAGDSWARNKDFKAAGPTVILAGPMLGPSQKTDFRRGKG